MNKKSIRNKPSQPAQKTLPAAVHAAAMSLDGETAGTAQEHLVVENSDAHDVPNGAGANAADDAATSVLADGDAAPAEPAAASRAKKAGKPVKISFTLPADEAKLFDALRHAHQADGAKTKKSTLLRAALVALGELDKERLAQLVSDLQPQKPVVEKTRKSKSKK